MSSPAVGCGYPQATVLRPTWPDYQHHPWPYSQEVIRVQGSVADDRVPSCGNEMALALFPLYHSNISYSQLGSLCPSFPKRNPALPPGPQHGNLQGRVALASSFSKAFPNYNSSSPSHLLCNSKSASALSIQ